MPLLSLVASLCAVLPSPRELHAPVPESPLSITLAWAGFARDAVFERSAAAQFGANRLVLAGAIESESTTVSILAETNRSPRTSAQWREALGEGRGSPFQAGAIACSEQRITLPSGGVANDFHAYVVAGGVCLDIHATGAALKGEPDFDRAEFAKLPQTVWVSFARRGTAGDLPDEVRELMHGALSEWPRWNEWLDAEKRTRRDDVALEFTRGELAVLANAKREQIVANHRASLALFVKLRNPSAQQRFAWMLAEESLGLALFESGKPGDALEPLRKSFEIADQLKRAERATIAYNLARACGANAQGGDAVKYLNEAIAGDARFRKLATQERAFATLSADRRFQALVRP